MLILALLASSVPFAPDGINETLVLGHNSARASVRQQVKLYPILECVLIDYDRR